MLCYRHLQPDVSPFVYYPLDHTTVMSDAVVHAIIKADAYTLAYHKYYLFTLYNS